MSGLFSIGDVAQAILDGSRPAKFFVGRAVMMRTAGVLPVAATTDGGQVRFSRDALALACVYNVMLDLGLSHPKAGKPEASPFTAAYRAMACGRDRIASAISDAHNTPWVLRLDMIHAPPHATPRGRSALQAFEGAFYRAGDKRRDTPAHAVATTFINVSPLIEHIARFD